jgi:hypothetical protein
VDNELKDIDLKHAVMVEKDYNDGTFNIYVRQGESMYIEYFCSTDCERKMLRLVELLKKERGEFYHD